MPRNCIQFDRQSRCASLCLGDEAFISLFTYHNLINPPHTQTTRYHAGELNNLVCKPTENVEHGSTYDTYEIQFPQNAARKRWALLEDVKVTDIFTICDRKRGKTQTVKHFRTLKTNFSTYQSHLLTLINFLIISNISSTFMRSKPRELRTRHQVRQPETQLLLCCWFCVRTQGQRKAT